MLSKNLNFISILGHRISSSEISDIVEHCFISKKNLIVNTINAHSHIVQKDNIEFRNALNNSNIIIPDGIGIVMASRLLNKITIRRVTGHDLFISTMKYLNSSNKSVFFLGSTNYVLDKIKCKNNKEYPNIKHGYLSPPFKDKFSDSDINEFINQINNFAPDVVFIGLTAPKQEILISSMHKYIDVFFISGIGAVFDFYAETIKRPNKVFIFFHLEWFGRFIKNPHKMFNRVFISMPLFIIEVIKNKIYHDK